MEKRNRTIYLVVVPVISLLIALAGLYFFTDIFGASVINSGNGPGLIKRTPGSTTADEVGVEVYDLSMYDESYQQYMEALGEIDEDWFPRQAIVNPKGPEGGDFPNAPLPIYDAYPGQEAVTEDGERYTITRTWIGDIAVGTEVTLEGLVGQGEWCFVTAETLGGWSSSGWVWCYRLYIPDRTWIH